MAKLKLDIFSSDSAAPPSPRVQPISLQSNPLSLATADCPPDKEVDSASEVSHQNAPGEKGAAVQMASPRFIPVGFYPEDLAILETAVFRLRRNGHRLANKSAVIRALILRFRNELDMVWLEANRAKKG